MAEPISDANIAEWERYVTQFDGTNNRLVRIAFFPRADFEAFIARIRAEQNRAGEAEGQMHGCLSDGDVARLKDEEFNAGVEAAAQMHDREIAMSENALPGALPTIAQSLRIIIQHNRQDATAIRALKRPIPKEMNDGA